MAIFPVQNELIDAIVKFASAKLTDLGQVREIFPKDRRPDSVPSLQTCQKIQKEVRDWLDLPDQSGMSAAWALIGRNLDANKEMVDPGISLGGAIGFQRRLVDKTSNEKVFHITWDWWITSASLRAVCGLAVGSIWQAELQDRVGYCERDGCGNYFIDRRSRGQRRQYCGERECNKARSRERTAASRANL